MPTKRKTGTTLTSPKKIKKTAMATDPVCEECNKGKKGVSNRIVGRVIRPGKVPREILVMRLLCEPCLMQEDGKRKK